MNEPGNIQNEKYDIIKKTYDIGKTYYEQVKIKTPSLNISEYSLININEYKNNKDLLNSLNDFKKELILKLPWKQETIYIENKYWVDKTTQ